MGPPAAPPSPWRVLSAAVAAQAAGAALIGGLPALSEELRREYGLSTAALGVALASVPAGMALTLLAWGVLADRVGERRVMATGLAGASVALVAAASAGSLGPLLVALFAAGVMAAATNAASGRAIVGAFGPARRGFALGIRQASLPVGAAVSAAVLPPVARAWGIAAAMGLLAAACAVAAGVAAVFLPGRAPGPAARPVHTGPGPLRDARLWRLAGASGLLSAAQFAFTGFLVVYLVRAGLGLAAAATCLVAVQLLGAAGRIALGRWSDVLRRRALPLRRTALFICACAGLASVAAPGGGPVAGATAVLAAFAGQTWNGLSYAAAAELAPEGRVGTALGAQNTSVAVMGTLGLPLVGLTVDHLSWAAAFALTAAFAGLAAVLLAPLVRGEGPGRAWWRRVGTAV